MVNETNGRRISNLYSGVMTNYRLPYGVGDLDTEVVFDDGPIRQVQCYVRGCKQMLRTPTRSSRGDVCPDHEIRCHYSSGRATYSYAEAAKNIIASPRLFAERIVGHSFKYESHRLGLERSEDSLSWNVWRSLQEGGLLHKVVELVTGEKSEVEPFLYLWGICCTDDELNPWDLLIQARERFESDLPVVRPLTEPDIALHLPGRYLILIEAKFTSPNTYYARGPRKDSQSLTLDELLAIYQFQGMRFLDVDRSNTSSRVHYQLWRNLVFAEWMAKQDHPKTKAYHLNLVRDGYEEDNAAEFGRLVNARYQDRFRRITWEQIYGCCRSERRLLHLCQYMERKTSGLRKAFRSEHFGGTTKRMGEETKCVR